MSLPETSTNPQSLSLKALKEAPNTAVIIEATEIISAQSQRRFITLNLSFRTTLVKGKKFSTLIPLLCASSESKQVILSHTPQGVLQAIDFTKVKTTHPYINVCCSLEYTPTISNPAHLVLSNFMTVLNGFYSTPGYSYNIFLTWLSQYNNQLLISNINIRSGNSLIVALPYSATPHPAFIYPATHTLTPYTFANMLSAGEKIGFEKYGLQLPKEIMFYILNAPLHLQSDTDSDAVGNNFYLVGSENARLVPPYWKTNYPLHLITEQLIRYFPTAMTFSLLPFMISVQITLLARLDDRESDTVLKEQILRLQLQNTTEDRLALSRLGMNIFTLPMTHIPQAALRAFQKIWMMIILDNPRVNFYEFYKQLTQKKLADSIRKNIFPLPPTCKKHKELEAFFSNAILNPQSALSLPDEPPFLFLLPEEGLPLPTLSDSFSFSTSINQALSEGKTKTAFSTAAQTLAMQFNTALYAATRARRGETPTFEIPSKTIEEAAAILRIYLQADFKSTANTNWLLNYLLSAKRMLITSEEKKNDLDLPTLDFTTPSPTEVLDFIRVEVAKKLRPEFVNFLTMYTNRFQKQYPDKKQLYTTQVFHENLHNLYMSVLYLFLLSLGPDEDVPQEYLIPLSRTPLHLAIKLSFYVQSAAVAEQIATALEAHPFSLTAAKVYPQMAPPALFRAFTAFKFKSADESLQLLANCQVFAAEAPHVKHLYAEQLARFIRFQINRPLLSSADLEKVFDFIAQHIVAPLAKNNPKNRLIIHSLTQCGIFEPQLITHDFMRLPHLKLLYRLLSDHADFRELAIHCEATLTHLKELTPSSHLSALHSFLTSLLRSMETTTFLADENTTALLTPHFDQMVRLSLMAQKQAGRIEPMLASLASPLLPTDPLFLSGLDQSMLETIEDSPARGALITPTPQATTSRLSPQPQSGIEQTSSSALSLANVGSPPLLLSRPTPPHSARGEQSPPVQLGAAEEDSGELQRKRAKRK